MTTIKFFGGDLGNEVMMVRCDLTQASSPVEVDYCNDNKNGDGWESTPMQCADMIHSYSRLVAYGERLVAQAIQVNEDTVKCNHKNISNLMDLAEGLQGMGDQFSGNDPVEIAKEWQDHSFELSDASKWWDVGVWDADVARALVDAEMTPKDLTATAEAMTEDMTEEELMDAYTDGCPIYSACNNDIDVQEIIDAWRKVAHG